MRLPKIAIENHQFTIIVICLLVLSGLVSFFTMPRTEDPQISPPGTSVIVVYPGANPTAMEELVVDPIEEAINELEDLKDIKAIIENGLAVIVVEFLIHKIFSLEDNFSSIFCISALLDSLCL